jgi:hypothetical protein
MRGAYLPRGKTMNQYPVRVDIDDAAPQSRLAVFFRILLVIPHAIVLYFLGIAQFVVTVIAWFAIIILGKYPAGLFGFSTGVLRWNTAVNGYALLLTGKYPPFSLQDTGYPIRLDIDPAISGRSRLTAFFRIILAIPHFVVLYFLRIFATILVIISWFVALITGRVPDGLHKLIGGYVRWNARATAYLLLLADPYPPFSMD